MKTQMNYWKERCQAAEKFYEIDPIMDIQKKADAYKEWINLVNTPEPEEAPIPNRCPICNGNGIVPAGFYNQTSGTWSSSEVTEPCRACNGTGIVWMPLPSNP